MEPRSENVTGNVTTLAVLRAGAAMKMMPCDTDTKIEPAETQHNGRD